MSPTATLGIWTVDTGTGSTAKRVGAIPSRQDVSSLLLEDDVHFCICDVRVAVSGDGTSIYVDTFCLLSLHANMLFL